MQAALLTAPKTFELRDIPKPDRQEGEILVRVTAAGVCGSDLHFYSEGRIGEMVLTEPFVMGHECAGIVDEAGEFSSELPKGTRVAIDPSVSCGSCVLCRAGRANLCLNLRFLGFPPESGAYAEFISVPRSSLHLLPDSVKDREAPLLETLAVALHTVELAGDVSGRSVAVLGAGPVGLLILLELRRQGARVALVTEPVAYRRELAGSLGAKLALDPGDTDTIEDCRRRLDGLGPEVVIEAAGEPGSFRQAMEIVRRGGSIVYCGIYAPGTMPIDFTPARRKELRMVFVRRSMPHNCVDALRLVSEGAFDLSPFAGKIYPLNKVTQAFRDAEMRVPGLIKAIIMPSL